MDPFNQRYDQYVVKPRHPPPPPPEIVRDGALGCGSMIGLLLFAGLVAAVFASLEYLGFLPLTPSP
jgi:hypothetical protein